MAKSVVRWSIGGVVVLALGLLAAGAAAKGIGSGFVTCADELGNPPEGEDFCLLPEKLPFDALEDFPAQRDWGVLGGAGFRVEIPENWNGDLVMYAHGFRGATDVDTAAGRACRAELTVSNPPLRPYLLANGYAWAASSYRRNCYDVRAGVNDTNRLVRKFSRLYGKPNRVFITGQSMGGHITGAAMEQSLASRGVDYAGAVPMCGVMGDIALFDYFLDYIQVARQLTLGASAFPAPADFLVSELPLIIEGLSGPLYDPGAGVQYPFVRSEAGDQLKAVLENISGGPRPVFEEGFNFWESFFFLFTLNAGGDGTIANVVDRVLVDNTDAIYQFDQDPALTPAEAMLNADVTRVARDPVANSKRGEGGLKPVPVLEGKIRAPVVSLHTLGDLFVPFVMEQEYARDVAAAGNSDLLVSRATRDVNHCGSNLLEQSEAFQAMVDWVDTGVKPAGDDVLDPAAVADPAFGCQFTRGDRMGLPACPAP
ncbi:MAG: alpha/beta hydrolase [Proteobacteria bacterium]|nr:alpha/beta hydrolase [Pseudomonadota bacterium]